MKVEEYISGIRHSKYEILAKAITLIESSLEKDKKKAIKLIDKCIPFSGESIRIGISGTPGVGKSTFIEKLGFYLKKKYKIAILAIDPSSSISKGSILGDKTRMNQLTNEKNIFIRPSPSRGQLGGVCNHTRDSIILCEAAGFNIILIETVGVGQVEVDVAGTADTTVVVVTPGMGDAVQANKAGLLEVADIFVVNKADRPGANDTRRDLDLMLDLGHVSGLEEKTGYRPPIIMANSLEGEGAESGKFWTSTCR